MYALTIIRREQTDSRDVYGNPITVEARIPWRVRAVAPGTTQEPAEANRTAVRTGLTVYADPRGARPGPHDTVEVDGEAFEVVGDVQDWTRGPHTRRGRGLAGIVVTLERRHG